jgi:hypothetical protein
MWQNIYNIMNNSMKKLTKLRATINMKNNEGYKLFKADR